MKKWFKIVALLFGWFLPAAGHAGDYTYTTNNNTITITAYTGSGGAMIIPGTIEGLPVTSIGANAFQSKSSLTSVTIPDSVTNLGGYAFQYCYALTNVLIGNSVANIGTWAFYSCNNLTGIVIPASVTNFGSQAFAWCTSLTGITVNADNPALLSVDGVLFDKNQTMLIQYPGGKDAISYTIPGSVTYIWEAAFYRCTTLVNVTVPTSVTSISNWAFAGCKSLSEITVNAGNPVYLSADGVLFNTNQTTLVQYPAGKAANSYTIPSSVSVVGEAAFYSCTNLTSIVIPDSVTNIDIQAFNRCYALTNALIGINVAKIGDRAFQFCTTLTGIVIPNSVTNLGGWALNSCYALTNVLIGANVANIGESTFSGCSNLTSVIIPNSITNIGRWAFYNCPVLTNALIGSSVVKISDSAFYYCTNLTSIVIPDSVTNIDIQAFSRCYALTNALIGNSVASIGSSAFYYCTNLTGVYFSGNAPAVGSVVFSGDNKATIYRTADATGWPTVPTAWAGRPTALWEWVPYVYTTNNGTITITGYTGSGGAVTIPDTIEGLPVTDFGVVFRDNDSISSVKIGINVTSIEGGLNDGAFSGCGSLTNVTLGSGVQNIGRWAFRYCVSLTAVTLGNGVTTIGYASFAYTGLTSITFPDSVTTIGEHAFSNCSSLTNAIIGNSGTSIGDYAFSSCGLTSITFPDSVTTIGKGAFSNCSSLTNAIIGNGVSSIGWSMFSDCTSLTSVTIPDSVAGIGYTAFENCTSLTSVTIPSSIQSITPYAFLGCTSLTSLYFLGNAPSDIYPEAFQGSDNATIYRTADATGWPPVPDLWAGRPTVFWDSDADGISDPWEERYFGGPTNANPNAYCSNGINTIIEAYIAGLNPTNSSSVFQTSVICPPSSGAVLRWNATSGRIYSVYWTTNLLNSFQPLKTNYTGGAFTDSTHSAAGKCFYKIDVRLGE